IAQYRKTLEMDPSFVFSSISIAWVYEHLGKYHEALTELNKLRPALGDDVVLISELGYVDAKLGEAAEARNIIEQLKERSKREYIDAEYIAMIYVGLGDKDQAFAWLEKAYQERSTGC